jgi:predicted N-acetyltransferase YhbS
MAITERELTRAEIGLIWSIDRSEVIDNIYVLRDGRLVLKPDYFDMLGWPEGEADKYTPLLVECFDRGGWFYGMFDGESLVGMAALDSKPIGKAHDWLQLKMLHVGSAYRKHGIGRRLFELAKARAKAMGARALYVSATPSENTIQFYLRRGCVIAAEPEPALFELEPEDIHLVCAV